MSGSGPNSVIRRGRLNGRFALGTGRIADIGQRLKRAISGQGALKAYGALAGPICGERTGFAIPKEIVTPCLPHRVESASREHQSSYLYSANCS